MSEESGGFVVLWEFDVPAEGVEAFRRAYGPGGSWAALFRRAPGYLGTMLLADRAAAGRFITVDRWIDEAAYHTFRERFAGEYAALDASCEALTRTERPLGTFLARDDGTQSDLA